MKYQDKAELLKNATEVTSDFFVKNDEPFNRVNLTMLADYLEGKLSARFHMGYYQDGHTVDGHTVSWRGALDCGTVGCAVGHGPYAGIPKTTSEEWGAYSRRAFISSESGDAWMFCFDGSWARVDNTPQGAAKRIRYFLKHGSDAVEEIMDKGLGYLEENYSEIINA